MTAETPAPSGPAAPSARATARPAEGWLDAKERGGVFAIRLTVWLTTVLGRPFGRLVARFVTVYYTLTSPRARRAIRDFRRRLEGREISGLDVYRHLLRFVHCTLDAFFFVSGKSASIHVTRTGHEHLLALQRAKKGAILLGAHVGSFYAMRGSGQAERLPLYALMYTKNARVLNDALATLDPEGAARLLEIDPEGGLDSMLRVKELLEGGALIAILGDRIPPHASADRIVRAPFLGEEAPFPAGPFLLASMLKCPVYLTVGLHRDPDTYDLYCEPFAERIDLPRRDRQAGLRKYVRAYAERLEHFARKAPDNWFNFYDFWAATPAAQAPASLAPEPTPPDPQR